MSKGSVAAVFEADSTFAIAGRGLVLAGWVVEGEVKRGMVMSIPGFPRALRIDSIEMIRAPELPHGMLGLVFEAASDEEELVWRSLDVNAKLLTVEEIVD